MQFIVAIILVLLSIGHSSANDPVGLCGDYIWLASAQNGVKVSDCHETADAVYWRIDNKLNWQDARRYCKSFNGADIVSIHNFDEKRIVNDLAFYNTDLGSFPNLGTWIGLIREPNTTCEEQNYYWADNSTFGYTAYQGYVFRYTDWLDSQPNCALTSSGDTERCVHIVPMFYQPSYVNGPFPIAIGWNDAPCDAVQRAICKLTKVQLKSIPNTK